MWNEVREEIWMFMKEISSDGDVNTVIKFVTFSYSYIA